MNKLDLLNELVTLLETRRKYCLGEAEKSYPEVVKLIAKSAQQSNAAEARLYGKYRISKADGTPTDPNAQYFVLRIDTDQAARMALETYAKYIEYDEPEFADDLRAWIAHHEPQYAGGRNDKASSQNGGKNPSDTENWR